VKVILAALFLAIPSAAQAQAQLVAGPLPGTAPTTPDPARLQAAKKLLEVLLPPARRETLITSILAVSTTNITKSMGNNPAFAKAFSDDDRVAPLFRKFLLNQQAELREQLSANMPGMMTAMQNAYARRFSSVQMDEIRAFFASPTGQLYMDQSTRIMGDPDVMAWQQKMIGQQMAKMPEATRALAAEIMALPAKETK
jgi:Uncharacterized protein conserved in bacteria (DUF2059)